MSIDWKKLNDSLAESINEQNTKLRTYKEKTEMAKEETKPADVETSEEDEDELVDLMGWKDFANEGDFVAGFYLGYQTVESGASLSGKLDQHMVVTDEGIVRFNGTAQMAVLKNLDSGTFVRIVYAGTAAAKVGKVKIFHIKVKQKQLKEIVTAIINKPKLVIDVPAIAAADEDPDADPFADEDAAKTAADKAAYEQSAGRPS